MTVWTTQPITNVSIICKHLQVFIYILSLVKTSPHKCTFDSPHLVTYTVVSYITSNVSYTTIRVLMISTLPSPTHTNYLMIVGVNQVEFSIGFVPGHAQWVLETYIPPFPIHITKCKQILQS